MKIIHTRREMFAFAREHAEKVGFIPTMGYLHAGHFSLIERAKNENSITVVSIFINPAQFNNPEDFEKYPIDIDKDIAELERLKVDALFLPTRDEIYPHGIPTIRLLYPNLMNQLCGAHRAGHFEGVLLIVHNLFQWVNPARAYFGLKDYQQYLLIKKMVSDLEFRVDVVGCAMIRESDGLALSSRNVRLSLNARQEALKISQALFAVRNLLQEKRILPHEVKGVLNEKMENLQIEYANIYDAKTLLELKEHNPPSPKRAAIIAVAAVIDEVRLIDNVLIDI